jgi:hypothetical protein
MPETIAQGDVCAMKRIFRYWLVIAIVASGLAGLLYIAVQQAIRSAANDPQIQLAEDAATALDNGGTIQSVVPAREVDIATSLAPYIIVFNTNGKPVASSAQLNGQVPTIPPGVFDFVRQNGEDKITWQPQPGVRSAIVVVQFHGPTGGFVLAGRSLREVEQREDNLLRIDWLGLIGILVVSFLVTLLLSRKPSIAGMNDRE